MREYCPSLVLALAVTFALAGCVALAERLQEWLLKENPTSQQKLGLSE